MKCFMFKSVGLAIMFSLTLCLSTQAMPQGDDVPIEVAEEQQVDDSEMALAQLGLRGAAIRELLGQQDLSTRGYQFLLPSGSGTWKILNQNVPLSLDGEFADSDWLLVQTYMDLGLKFQPVEPAYLARQLGLPEGQGLIVREQDESGAGFKNGFRVGDIVLAVDDVIIGSTTDVMATLAAARGSQSLVKAKRDGEPIELTIKLSEPDPAQSPERWILGIYPESISELAMAQLNLEGGIVVSGLTEGGAAGKSGLVEHDIITHVDGQSAHTPEQLREILAKSNGEELKVDFVRGGNKFSVSFAPERHVDQVEVNWSQDIGDVKLDVERLLGSEQFVELFANEGEPIDDFAATGSKLAELEQQVNELTKAVQKLQESIDGFGDQQEDRK